MSQTLSAITVPNVKLPLSEAKGHSHCEGWIKTDYTYRGCTVYQSQHNGSLVYEADYSRLVALPDAMESIILDAILLDLLAPGFRLEEATHA